MKQRALLFGTLIASLITTVAYADNNWLQLTFNNPNGGCYTISDLQKQGWQFTPNDNNIFQIVPSQTDFKGNAQTCLLQVTPNATISHVSAIYNLQNTPQGKALFATSTGGVSAPIYTMRTYYGGSNENPPNVIIHTWNGSLEKLNASDSFINKSLNYLDPGEGVPQAFHYDWRATNFSFLTPTDTSVTTPYLPSYCGAGAGKLQCQLPFVEISQSYNKNALTQSVYIKEIDVHAGYNQVLANHPANMPVYFDSRVHNTQTQWPTIPNAQGNLLTDLWAPNSDHNLVSVVGGPPEEEQAITLSPDNEFNAQQSNSTTFALKVGTHYVVSFDIRCDGNNCKNSDFSPVFSVNGQPAPLKTIQFSGSGSQLQESFDYTATGSQGGYNTLKFLMYATKEQGVASFNQYTISNLTIKHDANYSDEKNFVWTDLAKPDVMNPPAAVFTDFRTMTPNDTAFDEAFRQNWLIPDKAWGYSDNGGVQPQNVKFVTQGQTVNGKAAQQGYLQLNEIGYDPKSVEAIGGTPGPQWNTAIDCCTSASDCPAQCTITANDGFQQVVPDRCIWGAKGKQCATVRAGAAIVSKQYFASGRYAMCVKFPEAQDGVQQMGASTAFWMFHYQEFQKGDARYFDQPGPYRNAEIDIEAPYGQINSGGAYTAAPAWNRFDVNSYGGQISNQGSGEYHNVAEAPSTMTDGQYHAIGFEWFSGTLNPACNDAYPFASQSNGSGENKINKDPVQCQRTTPGYVLFFYDPTDDCSQSSWNQSDVESKLFNANNVVGGHTIKVDDTSPNQTLSGNSDPNQWLQQYAGIDVGSAYGEDQIPFEASRLWVGAWFPTSEYALDINGTHYWGWAGTPNFQQTASDVAWVYMNDKPQHWFFNQAIAATRDSSSLETKPSGYFASWDQYPTTQGGITPPAACKIKVMWSSDVTGLQVFADGKQIPITNVATGSGCVNGIAGAAKITVLSNGDNAPDVCYSNKPSAPFNTLNVSRSSHGYDDCKMQTF